jgi:hypothetical protein
MTPMKLSEEYLQSCRSALAAEQAKSLAETANWAHVDKQLVHAQWNTLYEEMAPMIGVYSAESMEIQKLIHRHFSMVSKFFVPSSQAYIGMALFYAENADMKTFHLGYHPDLVTLLGEAIPVYAQSL